MAKEQEIIIDDVLEGLNACISVNIREPQFTSQSKEKISGPDEKKAIYDALVKEFRKFLREMPENDKKIVLNKIKNNAKARVAAEVAKLTKKKSLTKNTSPANLPSKLKDCKMAGKSDLTELYIAEGDSAAGTILAARDANYQGCLPIRGKCLNLMKMDFTKKSDVERMNKNTEINDMIKALGAGVREHFDIDKSRYGKVFFAADMDVDGFDICVLLLGIFYVLFKPMIEEGRVYRAVSPLFEIKYRKNGKEVEEYAMNEKERGEIERRLKKNNTQYKIQRAKGLGELDNTVFAETVLDPETRIVQKISIEDAEKAFEMLNLAIGTESADSRKEWMINNFGKAASELDL